MIIGITGGTGCGKTTALAAIKELGGVVIDCDKVYHELLKTDSSLLATIENRFPGVVEDGVLNRKKLGSIVFSDKNALQDLNTITHSAVREKVLSILVKNPTLVAIDAIELFDGGLAKLCDVTVAVTAPENDRLLRITVRDSISRDQALQRIRAQKLENYFREKCDYTLENNGTAEEFRKKCLLFFQDLLIIKENP